MNISDLVTSGVLGFIGGIVGGLIVLVVDDIKKKEN